MYAVLNPSLQKSSPDTNFLSDYTVHVQCMFVTGPLPLLLCLSSAAQCGIWSDTELILGVIFNQLKNRNKVRMV